MNPGMLLLAMLASGSFEVTQFTLEEDPAAILRLFRERPHIAISQAGRVLQFHGTSHSQGCDDGRQWVFFFDRSDRLVSVTRNLESPVTLSTLLPKHARVVRFETGSGYPLLRVRLPDGRELIAAGAKSVGDVVSQVQLMQSADVTRFYPGIRPAR